MFLLTVPDFEWNLSYLMLSYVILSYLVLSCLALSCLILSCRYNYLSPNSIHLIHNLMLVCLIYLVERGPGRQVLITQETKMQTDHHLHQSQKSCIYSCRAEFLFKKKHETHIFSHFSICRWHRSSNTFLMDHTGPVSYMVNTWRSRYPVVISLQITQEIHP